MLALVLLSMRFCFQEIAFTVFVSLRAKNWRVLLADAIYCYFHFFLVWLRVWKLCTQIWQMLTNVLVLVCFELFPTLSPDYVYAIMCCSLMTKTCSTVGRCSMSQPQACRLESCYHSEIKCSLLVIWKFIWHSPTVEGSGLHWLEFTMSWMEEFSAFLVNLSLVSFFLFFFPSVLFLFKTRNWL